MTLPRQRRIWHGWLGQALGLLIVAATLHADPAAFKKANELFYAKQYDEAAAAYQKLSTEGSSANLLFNMGNAYFKADELGRALAAYQRALLLSPRNPDIVKNLRFTQQKVLSEPVPQTLRQQWLRKISLNEWTLIASFFATILLILLTLRQVKKINGPSVLWAQVTGGITFITILLLIMAVADYSGNNRVFAVRDGVIVRSNPVEQSPELFQATDGMEFVVIESNGAFLNVRSGSGTTGWIHEDDLALTRP